MYWDDHNPPHFHATYGEYEILIKINDFSIYAGYLPSRTLASSWNGLPFIKRSF
jgi:hypothetical protein